MTSIAGRGKMGRAGDGDKVRIQGEAMHHNHTDGRWWHTVLKKKKFAKGSHRQRKVDKGKVKRNVGLCAKQHMPIESRIQAHEQIIEQIGSKAIGIFHNKPSFPLARPGKPISDPNQTWSMMPWTLATRWGVFSGRLSSSRGLTGL